MIKLNGKHNTCKIFTDKIDSATEGQVTALLNQESCNKSKIRIMPDCHAGAGCVIGTTMTIEDTVIPNLVGVDIGCGVLVVKLKEKRIDLPKLDSVIRKYVPSGRHIHNDVDLDVCIDEQLRCYGKKGCRANDEHASLSVGTLGGGNHFIEIDKNENGDLYLCIHSGSRRLGLDVATYYQRLAYETISVTGEVYKKLASKARREFVDKLTHEGKAVNIEMEMKNWTFNPEEHGIKVDKETPYDLAYLTGQNMEDYLHDMAIVQKYAELNREEIARTIMKHMKLHAVNSFHTVHNYIDTETKILRKGAVRANVNEPLIIPMNMRDGSLLCMGFGNPDWNNSAPHGAGRLYSRKETKDVVSMSEYKKSMEGIYSTSVTKETLDESPMAYKPMEEIVKHIGYTVYIVDHIKPIYNFKAGSED